MNYYVYYKLDPAGAEASRAKVEAIFRAIERTGYRGFISHEFTPQHDVAAELADAFRLCAEA